MQLVDNVKQVLQKAWSIRLILLACLFSAAEAGLPLFIDSLPRGLFAALSGIAATGAMVARIVVQKELHDVGAAGSKEVSHD